MGKQIGRIYRIDNRKRIIIPDEIVEMFNLGEGDRAVYELEPDGSIKLCFRYLDKKITRKLSEVKKD